MKTKWKALLVVCGFMLALCLGNFTSQTTYQYGYEVLRAEADEEASTLNLTTSGDFANKPSGAKQLLSNNQSNTVINAVELAFCGGDAANDTFSYTVYAYRRTNGPATFVCSGVGTLGTQAVVKYPHSGATATSKFWADTLTMTDRWLKNVETTDSSGNNQVARIWFDAVGYEWIYVEITNADGATGTEAGDITVYYSYF